MYTHEELFVLRELSKNVARMADAQERTAKALEQLTSSDTAHINRKIEEEIKTGSASNLDAFL